MILTLLLLRHAEAEDRKPDQSDFDRALTAKGVRQSTLLADELVRRHIKPHYILCSAASRAKSTAEFVTSLLNIAIENIHFDASIYNADALQLLSAVRTTKSKYESLLLVGHNPTISSLTNFLDPDFKVGMNTCDLVQMELELNNWGELDRNMGTVKQFIQSATLTGRFAS